MSADHGLQVPPRPAGPVGPSEHRNGPTRWRARPSGSHSVAPTMETPTMAVDAAGAGQVRLAKQSSGPRGDAGEADTRRPTLPQDLPAEPVELGGPASRIGVDLPCSLDEATPSD